MSSSTLFQSMLLSKPRVENFHGSRIKSPGFIVSSRFSCVKFNASALSNLKVKSFMCCSAKVQNFDKSTTCSSTSKISNSGEADENYFEKVLIDRILKAVKWLKIPAVLVLFLTMTMSGRRGYSALAASSGSISSSSYESSALNQQHESYSPVLDFLCTILLLSLVEYIMYRLSEDCVKSKRDQTNIYKIEVKGYNYREDAAAYYLKLSNEEQKKFDFINAGRIIGCEKNNTNRRATILVATKGELHGFPNNIDPESLAKIEALNIFWTPLIENYGLTYMEVSASYPELYK
ncbi:hypothetical protein Q3G72_012239 [Acer saccharum]|nr:hypothetical protein Q3G72_012239 [Acer saccharum]